MKKVVVNLFFGLILIITSCNVKNDKVVIDIVENKKTESVEKISVKDTIQTTTVSTKGFYGKYVGVEFNKNGDVAHQFSNKTAKIIGKFLKESYSRGVYLKVDFKKTKITTIGLDLKGNVEFVINMPFIKVDKCDAFTGIVHCGTWVNQKNKTLNTRVNIQLKKLKRISVENTDQGYFSTDQGYKEYWVQFKHYKYQSNCK